jgi:hypothetical protein
MVMVEILLKPLLNSNTSLSKRMPPNRSMPVKKRRRSKLKQVRMLKALHKLLRQVKQNKKLKEGSSKVNEHEDCFRNN